ncbi:MAG: hypothetical protein ACI9KE_000081 [Polyangiales bacterium]|jgi:hypothetical protein
MRTLIHCSALLIVFALGCGDDSEADSSVDVGTEDVDVTDVGPPDVQDSSGPPAEWRHEPVITVQSTEPCEDWVPVEPMPRGLPGDATPRLLWRYRPANDPRYSGPVAAFYSGVSEPVVSPDGTIWVRGPRAAHVTQLSRDGLMRRWFRAGGADENDPGISARLGPLLPLPDGRVVAAIYSEDQHPRVGGLRVMDPRAPFSPAANATGGAPIRGLEYHTALAVGPGGMVYATGGNKLYATCQGERLMWTLTNEEIEPSIPFASSFSYLRVETDGSLVLSGGQRVYRVNPDTREIQTSQPIAIERDKLLALIGELEAPATSIYHVTDGEDSDLVVLAGGNETRLEGIANGNLSPTGAVIFFDAAAGALFALDPPYDLQPRTIAWEGQYNPVFSRWLDGGDWVGGRIAPGLQRFTGNGEEVWNVPVAAEGESAVLSGVIRVSVMDQTGVVFAALRVGLAPIELAAIQTDGLPPPMNVCVENGCNAHRDRWVRPAE